MNLKKIFIFIVLGLLLSACNSEEVIPGDIYEIYNNREQVNTLLGIASFREFTSDNNTQIKNLSNQVRKNNLSIRTIDEEVEEYPTYSYPFDYVKIHSANKFGLFLPEDGDDEALEAIEANCGLGQLEVIIAEFTTFIIDKEDYDKDFDTTELLASVSDTLICFKGSRGFYTILVNSGAIGDELNFEANHEYSIFSSHKKIYNDQIEKDFQPPIYCIQFEKTDDEEYNLSFKKDESISSLHDFFNDEDLVRYYIDPASFEKVSRGTLYSLNELTSLPEAKQIVQIVALEAVDNVIYVESNNNLFVIYIDDYTEYNEEVIKISDLWTYLEVGIYLEVTYNYYFEGYDPIQVYANSIKIE
ncbi:MAG: hypothetical protein PHX62_04990 [Bacilli bacterium]|nr:hypothetical protein [Bacilli bacterium]